MGLLSRLLRPASSAAVEALIRRDKWSIAEARSELGPAMIRFRTPVLSGRDAPRHGRVLRILWGYAAEGTGAMPERADSSAMQRFEDRFIHALEHDAHAVLVAVFTFDGVRQWVVYTGDPSESRRRLDGLPRDAAPYPIELADEDDPRWRVLHEEILRDVPWQK